MKRDDFVKNLRGGNDGKDFPRAFLEQLYDSISREQIKLIFSTAPFEDLGSSSVGSQTPPPQQSPNTSMRSEPSAETHEEEFGLFLQRGLSVLTSIQDDQFSFLTELKSDCAQVIFYFHTFRDCFVIQIYACVV
jgi:Sec7-like guanine-nucleotide exchange factor